MTANPSASRSIGSVRPNHWFIAAWPGMGNVAILAAGYLIQKLGLKSIDDLPVDPRFDIGAVEVRKGMVSRPRLPRNMLFQSAAGAAGPRLTVFIGESQPNIGALSFAHELTVKARELGADRIVTFASMAAQLDPAQQPRTFGAVTEKELIDELLCFEVQPLPEGQIGGLNGILLGAAAEQHVPGTCLMAQIPFYAAGVPNPRASRAVLDAFSQMSGIELPLFDLQPHVEAIDQVLAKMLNQLKASQAGEPATDEADTEEFAEPEPSEHSPAPAPRKSVNALDNSTRARIEHLFDTARADRAEAATLKRELDRLGVFTLYEDRFLDLFKRAE